MFAHGGNFGRAAAVALAALVALTGAACGGAAASPSTSPTSLPTLRGTPGHFDNGDFSFDYPAEWQVLAVDVREDCWLVRDMVVLGTGTWSVATDRSLGGGAWQCGQGYVGLPAGGIVVKVYWRDHPPYCASPAPTANATVGPNEVIETVRGDVASWEIAEPGYPFDWPGNPIFAAYTSDLGQLAKAEATVASFRWTPGAIHGSGCAWPSL
jgi:hypothetical protein